MIIPVTMKSPFTAHRAGTDIWIPGTIICWDYRIITWHAKGGRVWLVALWLDMSLRILVEVVREARCVLYLVGGNIGRKLIMDMIEGVKNG